MTQLLNRIQQSITGLDEEIQRRIHLQEIRIEAGALHQAANYTADQAFRSVIVAADAATYEAAGQHLRNHLAVEGINVHVTLIRPAHSGDVLADESALIQLLLDMQKTGADVIIAVGGGTIHDIVRYCAFTARVPFISVPTAPTVDGFNSKGAPIISRGMKITVPAIGPDAIFADLDVLVNAPAPLAAAGFGDMLGKATSLFDWQFGCLTAGEPYLEAAANITRNALARCLDHVEQIAKRDEEGVYTLISSLIESGLAMLLFGQSHPASGAEHHLSHYWEMTYIREGRRQLLHGAKVGVACIEICKLYRTIGEQGVSPWGALPHIAEHWEAIAPWLEALPNEQQLIEVMRQIGGPATIQELGIAPELLARSLREAHHVRPERYTLLRAYNERIKG
ncbi:sn-glycerol-1-phosphate dehydrogenase [Paenibacillus sedimenti]|uniref:Sn-glycerol-1-phosphate dehydrogenase n=1 Tax=Paenibacillus sedimenti TaxID=2770274 RepID=A0A926KQV3_9BACL|nr:sn-glycerol-1-phosphate dehydrogenase [Paenibacillus sedimenti]MBD0382275.1 sn-glycerol-1-phosphate dehydrogenase [Paenibacillus sedimenti]